MKGNIFLGSVRKDARMAATTTRKYLHGKEAKQTAHEMKRDIESQKEKHDVAKLKPEKPRKNSGE